MTKALSLTPSPTDLFFEKCPSFCPAPQPQTRERHIEKSWESMLERCIKSIVSIRYTRTRCLETETPGSFSATGFIVDAKRGLILSNRHVVSVSPVRAHAVLCNDEEIDLKPIYRDPIHDFGFFQYDPASIRFLNVQSIQLDPKGARVGKEIRVVGNNAGEKLSILSGTLARLDRDAPYYGTEKYNDINTFYFQAASGTSSGSSGSPVLDLNGRAIALNAGGDSESSSSFYLPLDRVVRVLACLQNDMPITRGTILAEFKYHSYAELAKLGLSSSLEKQMRVMAKEQNIQQQGGLVVTSILPGGPADNQLELGDILLTGNGACLVNFCQLADLLDESVDQTVKFSILREGSIMSFTLDVISMNGMIPQRFVEYGGGTLHDITFTVARTQGQSLSNRGVFVSLSGYVLETASLSGRSIITGLDHRPVRHLDDFIAIASSLTQGTRVPIRFHTLSNPGKSCVMLVLVDYRWHSFRLATRNDATGVWDYENINLTSAPKKITDEEQTGCFPKPDTQDPVEALTHSLVSINSYQPYVVDEVWKSHCFGAGVIVSLNPPLVVTDRDSVPVRVSAVSLTLARAITVPARVLFTHPFYNVVILTFDTKPILDAQIPIHVAPLSSEPLVAGVDVHYVGLAGNNTSFTSKTTTSTSQPLRISEGKYPHWRATNVDAIKVTNGSLGGQGGVLADATGHVCAFWLSFVNGTSNVMAGIPTHLIAPLVRQIQAGETPCLRGLDIECWTLPMTDARCLGLPESWIKRFNTPHVLFVLGISDPSSPSAALFRHSDILLTINGDVITSFSDLARYAQESELQVLVYRDGQELTFNVPTHLYDGQETTRVVGWQGAVLHEAHRAAKGRAGKQVPKGVYVSCCTRGSPADNIIQAGVWITAINQRPVHNLDELLTVLSTVMTENQIATEKTDRDITCDEDTNVKHVLDLAPQRKPKAAHQSHVRIKFTTFKHVSTVVALTLDHHYWPTWCIEQDASAPTGWKYTQIFQSDK